MRTKLHLVLALTCSSLMPITGAVAADAAPCVAVILDCSKSMEKGLPAGDAGVVATSTTPLAGTRMDAAKDALKIRLDALAATGNYRVSLWLFGHRLAWEQGVQEPNLVEQTDYLAQSLGFNVLSDLLPGDDVELARPMIKLDPDGLQPLYMKLDVVKAWGEEPLYLALVRTLDNFGRQVAGADRRIVVITDGANHQGLSKFLTTKAQVMESLDRRPIRVHIIRLGDDQIDRQAEAELKQIASQSEGSYAQATTADELAKQLGAAFDEPVVSEETDETEATTTGVSTGKRRTEAPKFQHIEGTVTLYKRPVRGAKIVLSAAGDQRQVFTNGDGEFILKSVPAGEYTLKCEATVKNLIRDQSQPVTVRPQNSEPLMVNITLEDGPSPYSGPAYQFD